MFLLGLYAGRKDLFGKLQQNISLLKKGLRYALFTILGSIVFAVITVWRSSACGNNASGCCAVVVGGFVFDLFNTSLALIYVCGILLLFQKEKWQRRLMVFYPVGRMGLTTYLMQTFFGTLIFFSCGLGLLAEIGALASFGLALGLFVFQIVFAKFWFRYFSFGPVEWMWRNLTYLKFQPLLLPKINSALSNIQEAPTEPM